jgi:serpin B
VKNVFFIIFLCLLSLTLLAQEDYLPSTISRNNAFSLNFYKELSNSSENIAISPFGLSAAMAMAYIGCEGKTQQEIASRMNFITPFGVLVSYKQLIKRYQIFKNNDVNLSIGNALWIGGRKEILKKYRNLLKVNFAAHIQEIYQKQPEEEIMKEMDRWVKKASNFSVLSLIRHEDIEQNFELIYTNYLFLDGNWDNPFHEQLTSREYFYASDGGKRKVEFMNQTSYLKYNENEIFQIVELPYAGRNISMVILLPKNPKDMETLEGMLSPLNFSFWTSELYNKLVSISIPKFKIEQNYSIATFLNDKGMESLFKTNSEFPRISKEPVTIARVFQKTIINARENKNTGFSELVNISDHNEKSDNTFVQVKAVHPFIFVVKDNFNQNILLIGKVNNPALNNLSASYQ